MIYLTVSMQVFVFLLGLIFGSFLNVVLLRYNTGMGLWGRSRCASCGTPLKWYELIPVLSFVIQKGKSRYTGAKLPLQYPVVEILTGLLFLVSYIKVESLYGLPVSVVPLVLLAFLFVISAYFVLISVYDIKHMIIPHQFSNILIALSAVTLFVSLSGAGLVLTVPSLTAVASGLLVAAPFFLLWLVSKGKWMGFADIKLALAMGWFLSLGQAYTAVVLSFWLGAIIGVAVLLLKKKKLKSGTALPFGPFLLLGLLLTYFFDLSLLELASVFIS